MGAVRSDGKLKDYYIPDYVLVPGLEVEDDPVVPCCPVIVFINSKSGGQLGGELLVTFRALLNPSQVIDLGEKAPDKVLHQVYMNLWALKSKGHQFADEVEDRLRIVVAGGDGTAGWLLSVISDLKLPKSPPVATVPLGTGNNVHFSFGWGKKNPGTDRASVEPFLERVKMAKEMKIDSWHIIMRMRSPDEGYCEPVAAPPSLELPHSLHAFQRVSKSDALNMVGPFIRVVYLLQGFTDFTNRPSFLNSLSLEVPFFELELLACLTFERAIDVALCQPQNPHGPIQNTASGVSPISLSVSFIFILFQEGYQTFRGGFWNYFSMGMDAQVSYSFHSERKLHPEKFKNQMMNQSAYLKLACSQGWFFPSISNAPCNIAELAKVKVMKKHGHWEDLFIPPKIRSIVCLNLPSFSGGLNPWGNPTGKKKIDRDLTPPYVDDALLEVVGFRNAWHGLALLAPNGHGTRLAQASRIRFEFRKGAADHTFMRIDGEPWKQPLPVSDDTVTIEISSHGQVTMLANPPCQSKSIHDPAVPTSSHDDEGADSSEEDDSEEDSEERRKFGAANTFRLPDEFDLARLT